MVPSGPVSGPLTDLVLTPSSATAAIEVGSGTVLVDDRVGRAYALNASGALLWACLDGESTLREICTDVAAVLDIPFARVAEDVDALATRLLETGLATAPGFVVDADHVEQPGCCAAHDAERAGEPGGPGEVGVDPRLLVEPPNY